jgi:caffeoyl-CoA O-methyltransferase
MSATVHERFEQYITTLFAAEDQALTNIQAAAAENGLPTISIAPFEGRLLQLLAMAVGAKKIVEIGTLAGYSGVWMARALPADGVLYTIEASSKHAQVARANFEQAGVADRVRLLEGNSADLLPKVALSGPFDMVFIDADKVSYLTYLAWAVEHLRVGGMVAAHNAFRDGRVMEPTEESDVAMDAFNRALAANERLESTIIAVGDGMAVGIKRR